MKPTLVYAILLGALSHPLFAETAQYPIPTPPFIARASLPAAWTITFARPAEDEVVDMEALKKFIASSLGEDSEMLKKLDEMKDPIAKPMIRTVAVTRTVNFTKETATFSDETTQTDYIFNIARITKHVAYDGLIRSRRGLDVSTSSPDYATTDFSGFEWLKPGNYKGVQTVQNRPCYVFEAEIETEAAKLAASMGNSAGSPEKTTARAFINVESKLPVALQLGRENRVYAFRKPSPADLNLPPEVAAEIKDWKAELTSATKAAPPP